jgi:kumamolisin
MKVQISSSLLASLTAGTLLAGSTLAIPSANAQGFGHGRSHHGEINVPETSLEHEGDRGERAHTNHLVLVAPTVTAAAVSPNASALTAPAGESPQSIRAVYNLNSSGFGTIAIVDAYHYATALNDFNVFSNQYGLPTEVSTRSTSSTNRNFQVVYSTRNGAAPAGNAGWNQEEALDIEWAHAMAPNAKIVLVEAASSSFNDLFSAVRKANSLAGVHQVSMSWGGGEFSSEMNYDSNFTTNGITYFVSSGDTGGIMEYPAASPNVVSTGGTTILRDGYGNFTGQSGWSGAGGGVSVYEPRPTYQNGIVGAVNGQRGVPDVSFDADPYSGVAVYDSTPSNGQSGWLVFGGTSVAAPSIAGIVNSAAAARGSYANSSASELGLIYSNLGNSVDYSDITSGTAGGFSCAAGWDFVTGVGTSYGLAGK